MMMKVGRTLVMIGAAALGALGSTVVMAQTTPSSPANLQIAGPVMMVADLERSLRFYTEGLGMAVGNRLPGNPGPGATVVPAAGVRAPFILLRQRAREASTSPAVEVGNGLSRIMLTVADAKAVEARLKTAGFAPSVPNARNIFFVTDPDGYRYEVMQMGAH